MANVRIPIELVEQMIFGAAPHQVFVKSLSADYGRRDVVFEIHGEDIPDVAEAAAVIDLQANRAGERFHTLTFKPL